MPLVAGHEHHDNGCYGRSSTEPNAAEAPAGPEGILDYRGALIQQR
jgi:hypothetical protein